MCNLRLKFGKITSGFTLTERWEAGNYYIIFWSVTSKAEKRSCLIYLCHFRVKYDKEVCWSYAKIVKFCCLMFTLSTEPQKWAFRGISVKTTMNRWWARYIPACYFCIYSIIKAIVLCLSRRRGVDYFNRCFLWIQKLWLDCGMISRSVRLALGISELVDSLENAFLDNLRFSKLVFDL